MVVLIRIRQVVEAVPVAEVVPIAVMVALVMCLLLLLFKVMLVVLVPHIIPAEAAEAEAEVLLRSERMLS